LRPGVLFRSAEDSGLIEPLGRWVLLSACREAAAWLKRDGPLRLSVNVSARQLTRDHFEETVREAIQETAFPAHQLEIEITESTLQVIEHSLRLLEVLKALAQLSQLAARTANLSRMRTREGA
jgi:EAL domain-containing protein (putative c-di-GMP-specific phosphodiesterase class I)